MLTEADITAKQAIGNALPICAFWCCKSLNKCKLWVISYISVGKMPAADMKIHDEKA